MTAPKITQETMVKTNMATLIGLAVFLVGSALYVINLANQISNNAESILRLTTEMAMIEKQQINMISTLSSIETEVKRLPNIEAQIQEIAKKN